MYQTIQIYKIVNLWPVFLLPLFVPLLDEHLMGIYFYCAKLIHVSAIYKLVARTLTDFNKEWHIL